MRLFESLQSLAVSIGLGRLILLQLQVKFGLIRSVVHNSGAAAGISRSSCRSEVMGQSKQIFPFHMDEMVLEQVLRRLL